MYHETHVNLNFSHFKLYKFANKANYYIYMCTAQLYKFSVLSILCQYMNTAKSDSFAMPSWNKSGIFLPKLGFHYEFWTFLFLVVRTNNYTSNYLAASTGKLLCCDLVHRQIAHSRSIVYHSCFCKVLIECIKI